jgi:hypothetical protein
MAAIFGFVYDFHHTARSWDIALKEFPLRFRCISEETTSFSYFNGSTVTILGIMSEDSNLWASCGYRIQPYELVRMLPIGRPVRPRLFRRGRRDVQAVTGESLSGG